jgi:hypothetical protein
LGGTMTGQTEDQEVNALRLAAFEYLKAAS